VCPILDPEHAGMECEGHSVSTEVPYDGPPQARTIPVGPRWSKLSGGKFLRGSLKPNQRDTFQNQGTTHFRISQTSSLLFSNLRFAHHSARWRIHASRLSSGCNDLFAMQNLKSSIFRPHFDISPCRYNDLSWTPKTRKIGVVECPRRVT